MTAFGPRAGGMRLIRVMLVALAAGVMLNTGTTVLLYRSSQARAVEIQALNRSTRALAFKTSGDARVTTAALCALRTDLELRAASSRRFLADHPDGIPGIPAKVIRDGISNQERTITALRGIDCK
jgi:hypothetical protein